MDERMDEPSMVTTLPALLLDKYKVFKPKEVPVSRMTDASRKFANRWRNAENLGLLNDDLAIELTVFR